VAFAGDLSKLPLADVFQSIHQNTMTGAVAIETPQGQHLISFQSGLLTGCAPPPGEADHTIGDELVRRRMVEASVVRPSRFFKRKGTLRRSITRRGIMNDEEFIALTRSVVLERVYDCFLLEEGQFEFLESYDADRFDPDEVATELKVGPSEILMEAMRRCDEWKRVKRTIRSFREVYVAAREPGEDDGEIHAEVLQLAAAGTKDLESILETVPFPRFKATEAIHELLQAGALRVATAPEYLEQGRASENSGDLEAAAAHYQRGLSYERGNSELNLRLIDVLVRLKRNQEAATECKLYAGVLLEQGDQKRAAEQYSHAAKLAPSDPLPLERLLNIQIDQNKVEEAQASASQLVKVYLQLGMGEKAKGVYPRLLTEKPKDRWLSEAQAMTLEELGEGEPAAALYRDLAQRQLDAGDEADAIGFLQRALALMPDDATASALLKDLESGEHQRRRHRRRRYVLVAALCLALGLGLGWLTYEATALAYLRESSHAAFQGLDSGPSGVLGVMEAYATFQRETFPYTFANRWSEETLLSLTALYLRELDRAGERLALHRHEGKADPVIEVDAQLHELLWPADGSSLLSLTQEAEAAYDGDQDNSRGLLEQALRRVDQARACLSRTRKEDRAHPNLVRAQRLILAVVPHLCLLEARLKILHPQVQAQLEAHEAKLPPYPPLDEVRPAVPAPSREQEPDGQ
jgi:tetratricopeptide (TPR) repeat protein